MNKPSLPLLIPGNLPGGSARTTDPAALVQQPFPTGQASRRGVVAPTAPVSFRQAAAPYVDPYLFETGYYASPAEYQELTRTAAARITLRADAEHARPKRRKA